MEEMIQLFLSAIKKRSHVLKLIENLEGLRIRLVCENTNELLVFHRGEVFLLVENDESAISYEISGQQDSIYSLLEGKEKLRFLINSRQLKVKAPFRTVLLIESIFYLTKPEEQYNKIIS